MSIPPDNPPAFKFIKNFVGGLERSSSCSSILGQIQAEKKKKNLIAPDLKNLEIDERNLFVLITELNRTDFMMHESILDSYRDFLLCDNFLYLMKKENVSTVHPYETRLLFGAMTTKVR